MSIQSILQKQRWIHQATPMSRWTHFPFIIYHKGIYNSIALQMWSPWFPQCVRSGRCLTSGHCQKGCLSLSVDGSQRQGEGRVDWRRGCSACWVSSSNTEGRRCCLRKQDETRGKETNKRRHGLTGRKVWVWEAVGRKERDKNRKWEKRKTECKVV